MGNWYNKAIHLIISKVVGTRQVRAKIVTDLHNTASQKRVHFVLEDLAMNNDSYGTIIVEPVMEPKVAPGLARTSRFVDIRIVTCTM